MASVDHFPPSSSFPRCLLGTKSRLGSDGEQVLRLKRLKMKKRRRREKKKKKWKRVEYDDEEGDGIWLQAMFLWRTVSLKTKKERMMRVVMAMVGSKPVPPADRLDSKDEVEYDDDDEHDGSEIDLLIPESDDDGDCCCGDVRMRKEKMVKRICR